MCYNFRVVNYNVIPVTTVYTAVTGWKKWKVEIWWRQRSRSWPHHIRETFIPAIIGKQFIPDSLRAIFSLPARLGGLGISNICETAELEYMNSSLATRDLVDAIYHQQNTFKPSIESQKEIANKIKSNRQDYYVKRKSELANAHPLAVKRQLDLLSEKGASCWLTSLPLKEFGFLLNKQ